MSKYFHSSLKYVVLISALALINLLQCSKSADPESVPPVNRPPVIPEIDSSGGSPADGAIDQSLIPQLKWTCTDPDGDSLVCDIYLGLDSIPPHIDSNITSTNYTPDSLEYLTTYFWGVVAKDNHDHEVSSPTWSFTTCAEIDNVNPTAVITYPYDEGSVTDSVTIKADAWDNFEVAEVIFYLDGVINSNDSIAPWESFWDAGGVTPGSRHNIQAVAVDSSGNQGWSEMIFVYILDENHAPQTFLYGWIKYINSPGPESQLPGIYFMWFGSDSLDWGANNPNMEFEWRLYGPYETNVPPPIYTVTEGNYIFPTVNLSELQDPVNGINQPIKRSKGDNFAFDTTDVWVRDTSEIIYDVFSEIESDTTFGYRFIFWIRARDDQHMIDTIPMAVAIYVFEPKYENEIAVLDETGYMITDGRYHPKSLDTVKAGLNSLIHGAGINEFDTASDYYFNTHFKSPAIRDIVTPRIPSMTKVLSYKSLILYCDDGYGVQDYDKIEFLEPTMLALEAGIPVLLMSRNMGNLPEGEEGQVSQMSPWFEYYFGVSSVKSEGWLWGVVTPENIMNPIFLEECIGGQSQIPSLPDVTIDFDLLDARYGRWIFSPEHLMYGLPEVGGAEISSSAEAIYTNVSKDGDTSPFHGMATAVRQDKGYFRSSAFLFTPLAFEQTNMQEAFTYIINWLREKSPGSQSSLGLSDFDRVNRTKRVLNILNKTDAAQPAHMR
ncbi:MAG: Ig-like domain-containing protein [candidate division Zixibacteria bacterium]